MSQLLSEVHAAAWHTEGAIATTHAGSTEDAAERDVFPEEHGLQRVEKPRLPTRRKALSLELIAISMALLIA